MRLHMRDWRLPALVGVALVFALMSGGRLPFFMLYLSAGIFLGGYLWTRHSMRRLEGIIQVEQDRVEVGHHLWVRIRLDNDSFLPIPWVELDDATPSHLVWTDMPRQATSVPLWGSRLLTLKLTARRRGHYTVGPIRTTLGDPFGLFQVNKEFKSGVTITVYPRVHHIDGLPIPLSQPFGPVRTRERAFEDPSNQAELRKYRPGDNPRHIHWKTSARMGELMLREYELNATTQMIVIPDLYAKVQVGTGLPSGQSTEETTVELAASLAALGQRRKIDTGLVCHAQDRFVVAPGHGQRTFYEILEIMSRVEATGRLPIEQVLETETAHLSDKATLVVITPLLTGHLADILIRLRAKHQVMLVLLRPESFAPSYQTVSREVAATHLPAAVSSLTGLLTLRRVSVFVVSAQDDLRRLADLKVSVGTEGVRGWSQAARLSAIKQ